MRIDDALLEREGPLDALSQALDLARDRGRLAAICGEAGIGKSSLLEAFARREQARADFLWGRCDALDTPSPLGPLIDLAIDLGGETAARLGITMPRAIRSSIAPSMPESTAIPSAIAPLMPPPIPTASPSAIPRHELFAAFVADLARRTRPTVVIVEDVHWADEATIDLLRYAGRRIDRTRALLVITWRDDEVDLDHPIHRLLGDWRGPTTLRLTLQPLSIDAVGRLAADPGEAPALHALTGGNPFFVTEVIRARHESVPASVREAVLARRAALGPPARAVLDFVSIVPTRADYTLLDATLGPCAAAIERCVAAGLLRSEPHAVTFRHELARLAVASALPPPRAHACHRRVLDALLARADRSAVLARIVHHAEACDDVDAIIEHAPAAARQAASLGAHRQAVEHYARALDHRERLADDARAELLERYAYEHYVTGDMASARAAQREALAIWKRLGVTLAIGRNVRWLSRLAWFDGDRAEADACANHAIDVLRMLPESDELAMAYSNRAQLGMLQRDLASTVAWGSESIALARRLGTTAVLSHALNNVGTARANAGDGDGVAQIEESLRLALSLDLHEHAARAYTNLGTSAVMTRRYADARRWLQRGLAYTAERDLDAWHLYMQAWRARLHAETGSWSEACADADAVLIAPRTTTVSRIAALGVLGLVRVRRGDAEARVLLDEALALARPTREPQRLIPILIAQAELAWFTRRPEDIAGFIREALDALSPGTPSPDRERLLYWLWKAGAIASAAADAARGEDATGERAPNGAGAWPCLGPYARLMRGDWRGAAAYWSAIGCPYEEAEALMEGDVAAVARALEMFGTLEAAPAIAWARQRLRQLGAGRLARGRRRTTRAHPAGLTLRESEILTMLARGLGNPQIAGRLFVSRKTIEHHVSSILGKLDVASRADAARRARAEGWIRD